MPIFIKSSSIRMDCIFFCQERSNSHYTLKHLNFISYTSFLFSLITLYNDYHFLPLIFWLTFRSMQRKHLFFLSALLLLHFTSINLKAQDLPDQDLPDALLWKISGKDLPQASYLYGTIHAICMEDMVFTDGTLKALDDTRQLALEIDVTDKKLAEKMQKGMLMNDNTQLQALLPGGEYQLLAAYFQDSLGIDLSLMQQMQPIFLNSLVYSKLLDCMPQSYEFQLSRMAGQQEMNIVGLETIEEQLKVFEEIGYQKQAEMLLQTIVEYPDLKAAYWNMVVSYKNQDLGTLYHVISDVQFGIKEYEDLMLIDRNQRWVPRMEQMAREKPTFFGVGAAHLPGNKGLIALLKRRGYTVEPLLN